ncbi:VWA domain-containing protein [Hyphomonas sp. WL0036]|uniref:vWA domain-containing protein n=1 Tax=Hyphomonas sediminis TaxID=2866160 RepID=UPI001C7FBA58|nr:VWA domain-containing protein [Hyphomonas sediminis]MBY9068129.1 VWA domain-containing protein [Hyphomonas sediminis]
MEFTMASPAFKKAFLASACALLITGPYAYSDQNIDQASAREQIMVVLDASGSMWGRVDGKAKIEILRDSYASLVERWDDEAVDAGLIVYGHRKKGDCNDIELVASPGPVDAASQTEFARKLNPKGKTPLGNSVRMAADVLKYTEQKATVLLLSDGAETCGVDPCALGRELEAAGVNFTAHVIGFDIRDANTQAQLRCLATETGGLYLSAANADELDNALSKASAEQELTAPSGYEIRAVIDDTTQTSGPTQWTITGPDFSLSESTDIGRIQPSLLDGANTRPGRLQVHASARSGDYVGTADFDWPLTENTEILLRAAAANAAISVQGPVYSASTMIVELNIAPRPDDVFALVPRGAGFSHHVRSLNGDIVKGTFEMRTAPHPGEYDLIYLYDPYGISREDARIPVTVLPSEIDLSAPSAVSRGQTFDVRWKGPALADHTIVIGPASDPDAYDAIAWPSSGNPISLAAPDQPGTYEIRYREDYDTLFVLPIEVK